MFARDVLGFFLQGDLSDLRRDRMFGDVAKRFWDRGHEQVEKRFVSSVQSGRLFST